MIHTKAGTLRKRWTIRHWLRSQFGRYGHQLMDGKASISREQQEQLTREEIFRVFEGVQQQEHSI